MNFSYTEECEDESYYETENIQRINNLEIKNGAETPPKIGKRNPFERNEDLFNQFLELKEFEKNLTKNLKKSVKTPSKSNENLSSSEEDDLFEISKGKTGNSNKDKESTGDDSSIEDQLTNSELSKPSEPFASDSSESGRRVVPQTESNTPARSRNGSGHKSVDTSSVNSQTELLKIKSLCKNILRKQKEMSHKREIALEESIKTRKCKSTKVTSTPGTPLSSFSSNQDISESTRNRLFTPQKISASERFKHFQMEENYSTIQSASLTSDEEEKLSNIESDTKQNQNIEQCEWEEPTITANDKISNLIGQKEMVGNKFDNYKNSESAIFSEEQTKFTEEEDSNNSKKEQCEEEVKEIGDDVSNEGIIRYDITEIIQVIENSVNEEMEENDKHTYKCDDELIKQTVQELIDIQESTEVNKTLDMVNFANHVYSF